jgi:two-component system, NtrC family, sensor histidine kinase HydH
MRTIMKGKNWFAPYSRLASRYLFFSLAAALFPIVVLSTLYDNYFVDLIDKVTDQKNTSLVVAYENSVRHFLKEREIELDDLKAQFDNPDFYTQTKDRSLALDLEAFLRVLVDTRFVYAVVFFNDDGNVVRAFPSNSMLNPSTNNLQFVSFDNTEIYGPAKPNSGLPNWFIMKSLIGSHKEGTETSKRGIGLVLRFATLTRFMDNFILPGIRQPYLQTPNGDLYDSVGLIDKDETVLQTEFVSEIIPGWRMYLKNETAKVIPPNKQVRYFLLLTAVFTALVILYLHYSISYRLNQQIERLVKRVERVAKGDIDTPLKVVGSWEIHRLSLSIESMRNQLQKFIRSSFEMERRASLGQMAAGIAHEVRNPLTTINTAIQALAKRETDVEKLDLMEIISDEISRTNVVITNLLDYARPRDPHAELLDVEEIINHTKVLADVVANKQNVSISLDIRHDDDKIVQVYSDAVHLKQILLNLVLNGLQAMEGLKQGKLIIAAYEDKGQCHILVIDNGCGIASDHISRVIEPFFTTKAAGTGLGLSICSSLISKNGGKIEFESKPEQGTVVHLVLPSQLNQKTIYLNEDSRDE